MKSFVFLQHTSAKQYLQPSACIRHKHWQTNSFRESFPDSEVHGANMGRTWDLSAPDGPHVGRMNLAIRVGEGGVGTVGFFVYWWVRLLMRLTPCVFTAQISLQVVKALCLRGKIGRDVKHHDTDITPTHAKLRTWNKSVRIYTSM